MQRNIAYNALTLRVKPSGESNREAWFLSAGEGILKATVFGGPKSKLRAQVAPFHEGKLWIYHDPVRDSRKVSDFDVGSYRTGIRELYERVMAANAVAETILASHGGGSNWPEALKLSGGVLDLLDTADAAASSRIAVYFFWRWAGILGVRPDLSVCASCACEAGRDQVLWYSIREEALFCENCLRRGRTDSPFRLGPGARLWLREIETLDPPALARVSPVAPSPDQWSAARALAQAVLAGALGKRLPTWDGI